MKALSAVCLLFVSLLSAQDHVPGRLLVRLKPGVDARVAAAAMAAVKARVDHGIPALRVLVLEIPEADRRQIAQALENSGHFEFVELDFTGKAQAVVPNDPLITNQLWLAKSKYYSADGQGAWDLTTGSPNIIVAVIDSGADGTHPDLAGKVLAGWNFLTGTPIAAQANSDALCAGGHGTAVTGVIGAKTNNGVGVAGGAWLSPIMPLIVDNTACSAAWSDVANAATYAADHGAKVINISIAGTVDSNTLELGLKYAWDHGVSIVAAAGNLSTSTCEYPGCSPWVVASAGGVDNSDVLDPTSNFGAAATIYAASGGTGQSYTTQVGGTYGYWHGTSFASPEVAAVIPLILALSPTKTPAQIKALLADPANSDPIAAGLRLNARKLVAAVAPPPPPPTACAALADGASATCTAVIT
jgi:thermitase